MKRSRSGANRKTNRLTLYKISLAEKRGMDCGNRAVCVRFFNEDADFDFTRCNHLNIDVVLIQRFKHL